MMRADHRDERGSITLPVLVLTPALLMVAGLVVDGGYALSARQRAFNVAEQAARAGAAAIDTASLRAGDARLIIDCTRPEPCAQELAAGYVDSTEDRLVGPVQATATTVTVSVEASRRTVVLSVIGIQDLTVQATGTAEVQRGITGPEVP